METIDTRDALKAAAMRLFAERGVEAVSVRDIILASGAKNGGSLNYYFGTKEGLILEILRDIFEASSEGWLDGLSELLKEGGPRSVRDIVRVIAYAPERTMPGEKTATAARVLASLLATRRKFLADHMRRMNLSVFNRLLMHLRELRADIPEAVMQQRLVYLAWYMSAILSAREAALDQGRGGSKLWTDADALGNLVDTATALIEAPMVDVSGERGDGAKIQPRRVARSGGRRATKGE